MADQYSVSTTPEFSELLTTLVSRDLLQALRGGLTYAPQGALRLETYQNGTDDSYTYGQVPDLTAAIPPALDELIPPAVELIGSVVDKFSTVEYARSIGFSSKLLRTSPISPAAVIAERVSRNAQELINLILKAEWAKAHSGEATIGAAATTITTDALIGAVSYLQAHDVPPMPNGFYACLCSPYLVSDLRKETGDKSWSQAASYQDMQGLEKGVLGRWNGIEFFSSSISTPASPATQETAIVAGADSIAVADLGSLATYLVLPTASIADPVAQRGIASYRLRLGAQAIAHIKRQGDTVPVYGFVKLLAKLNPTTVAIAP